jgi:hypothetical protein
MTGTGVTADLELVATLISSRMGWLDLLVAGRGSPLPWSCADVVEGQERGEDPTGPWRSALTTATTRQYRRPPPPSMPAAFVMLWYLDLLAHPLAYAAALGPWVLDVSPGRLRFDLHTDQHYPQALSLSAGGMALVGDAAERAELAHDRYLAHAERFVATYRPGVKMSSRQRLGAVHDTWAIATRRAAESCLPPPAPAPTRRQSCCFIFTLPGATTCAACPRLTRKPSSSVRP